MNDNNASNGISKRFNWLPEIGTWKFHLLLGSVAIFILGPLGGVTATYMNFSLGFFVGGQVLAGILGSAITYGYGAEGRHGANYIQTLSASVASMAGMAVLIQAMHWLGFEVPDTWKLIVYYLCIGMFGVGVGMLYTPILVDKMHLTYPSGFAVANILRALTDKALLKISITKLALGSAIGFIGGLLGNLPTFIAKSQFSGATFGAGMVVGPRIALPAIFVGLLGEFVFLPMMISAGWLEDGDPFRKLGFVAALGAILGASIVDITLVGRDFVKQLGRGDQASDAPAQEDWKRVNSRRLWAWVIFWGVAVFIAATQLFDQEPLYVLMAIGLVFVFMLVNGISLGISDSNPISSAFVLTVLIMASVGLGSAIGGLITASILLISVSIGGDMQQDRSTGWRLGSDRTLQFRYQVIGVTMGALLAVGMASFFMGSNPSLYDDQTNPKAVAAAIEARAQDRLEAEKAANPERFADTEAENERLERLRSELTTEANRWQSAMTYKFVGALDVFVGRDDTSKDDPALQPIEAEALVRALLEPENALIPIPAGLQADLNPHISNRDLALAQDEAFLNAAQELKARDYATQLVEATRNERKRIETSLLFIGIGIGLTIEIIRKILRASQGYQKWKTSSRAASTTDFVLDVTIFASPYASSFGGFVNLLTSIWFGAGGTLSAINDALKDRPKKRPQQTELPADMSTNSLVGGGLIAGESLYYLFFGLLSLVSALFL